MVYDNVHFDATRRELAIDGTTDAYQTLAQQLQAFAAVPEVEQYLVTQSRVVDGKIKFRLTATLAAKLLK